MRHLSYSRVHGSRRGFKLNPRKFSVQGLRARFVYLFKLLSRWRFSYGHALKPLKKGINRSNIKRNYSSRRSLVVEIPESSRLSSFGDTNSFYSEAIADCLEFIKRTSISVDETPD